ncbi:hypothetical protein D9619_003062 [Psilocybe cf. subviscida]|uniref:Uncharacterized protein n=1 Tax=Psilocybe cf. subviscida TaxID=2480587 RepID=A0A8H5AZ23_9AGAR|nr:hypothetical protein D9619_003062 [Psilocybe cf. subviscida]
MAETSTDHPNQIQSTGQAHRIICVTSKSSQDVEHTQTSSLEDHLDEILQKQALASHSHSHTQSHPDSLLPPSSVFGSNNLHEYSDIVLCGDIDDPDDEQLHSALASENPTERPMRVRFRSRVRITSGLRRHRHSSQDQHDFLTFSTASSSRSGSPSSSISAPLRSQAEDDVGKPGWGTLGQRVSLLAQGNAQRRTARDQRRRTLLTKYGTIEPNSYDSLNGVRVNEQTPLIHSSLPVRYLMRSTILDGPQAESSALEREIDLVFGPWPARLWNHHETSGGGGI